MKDALIALKKAREELGPEPTIKTYAPALDHLDNAITLVNSIIHFAIAALKD